MLDHGLPPGLMGGGGITLLHVAAQHGRALIVKQLLVAGAQPDCKDIEVGHHLMSFSDTADTPSC